MKEYKLIETANEYPFVVVSTSYANPIPYIFEIKDILVHADYKGFILIDLLLSNGFTDNRFLEVFFDGQTFDILNTRILEKISSKMLDDLYCFYSNNPELIENNNILPEAQKYLLLNKILVK